MTITDPPIHYALVSSAGAENRVRIVKSIHERPKNTSQLATELGLDYKTVSHHLGVLEQHGIVRHGGNQFGTTYILEPRIAEMWGDITELIERYWGEQTNA